MSKGNGFKYKISTSMNLKRKFLVLFFSVLVNAMSANLCLAEEGEPDPEEPGAPPDTPVDGGVTLLLAAGAAYGAKRVSERKRMK